MEYEVLEHRADLKIRAFGKTKEELFQNVLLAMVENMKPELKESSERTKREINVKSLDLASLLVDFLSEVLYLSQVNKEIYTINFQKMTDGEIEGELTGQKVERYGEDIKAVTYHNLDVHQNENGNWEAIVIFDI